MVTKYLPPSSSFPAREVQRDHILTVNMNKGMGNRFKDMPNYHNLILGHAILAVITFLFIVPAAILTAQFYHRSGATALRIHIYLQILTVALTTVIFVLGWVAVGPSRSLTNPHHGIGLAIYVLVLVQAIGGWWVHHRGRRHIPRKLPVTLYLHQWIGRAICLLAIAQVALGLTLYGSPKFTFVLYSIWGTFLLVLFFILCYRALPPLEGYGVERSSSHGGTVIEDKRPSRWGGFLGPLAAGAGAAALLGRRRDRSRSRSQSRSRVEVIPSRRTSRRESGGSYIEEEKFEKKKNDGFMDKLMKGAAVLGAAGLAKSWYDKRQRKKEEESEYSSVAPDTPSRRQRRPQRSEYTDESSDLSRTEEGRSNRMDDRRRPILPGPGDPVAAAAALSASEPRPSTPRRSQRHSYDSDSYTYDTYESPSRRSPVKESHGLRNGILAGLGIGWLSKKVKDKKDKKEQDRLDREEDERIEQERLARRGSGPSRFTGDGYPSPSRQHGRRSSRTDTSDLSSVMDDPHAIRPGSGIPPIPAALAGGAAADAGMSRSRPRRDSSRDDTVESVSMPPAPYDPQGVLHEVSESGSEDAYQSAAGSKPQRKNSSRRRREGEAAAAAAALAASALANEEEARRRRSRSRHSSSVPAGVSSPPVSVKVKVHGDKDRNVTLRRLTEAEAAAEREARSGERRRRRADSMSSLSGTDTATSRRRYRRDERDVEARAESSNPAAGAGTGTGFGPASSVSVMPPPPPMMEPLSPPSPAFAGGRKPKDSAYYSGRPMGDGIGTGPAAGGGGGSAARLTAESRMESTSKLGGLGSGVSPSSHGTWSQLSPDVGSPGTAGGETDPAAERRRRRRAERNQRGGTTVDFD